MKKIGNKIKQNAKNITAFILGAILTGGTVYAATILPSSQVGYDNSTSGLAATDVQGALDELNKKASRLDLYEEIYGNLNTIELEVSGRGEKRYLSSNFASSSYPHMVYINGAAQDTVTGMHNFPDQENTVALVWNNAINSTASMFIGCVDITSLDLSSFDTSQVTNMKGMFYGASNLTSLDLSSFDTSQVTNMSSMFSGASSLTSLDLSSFNTSQVTNMSSMFYRTSSLTSLDLSGWDTSQVQYMNNMFSGANPNLQVTINCENLNLIDQILGDLGSGHYTCAN